MNITRRNFIKATGLGAATIALGNIGCSSASAQGYSKQLKIKGAREVISICPYCSVCCHFIAHVKNGKVVGRSSGYMSSAKLKSFIKKHQ